MSFVFMFPEPFYSNISLVALFAQGSVLLVVLSLQYCNLSLLKGMSEQKSLIYYYFSFYYHVC